MVRSPARSLSNVARRGRGSYSAGTGRSDCLCASPRCDHRDLKPGNILLSAEGIPKIADLRACTRTDDVSHLTVDGTIMGTPSYMSPEQAKGEQSSIGPLSDVYSLGAILYELLTVDHPFARRPHGKSLCKCVLRSPQRHRCSSPSSTRSRNHLLEVLAERSE